ncbi:hypothetical protein GCM10009716_15140 [Streptomyces sodiiphilus]|uniref:Uncharacterized protein n=1 Tax=Streptomyces sodiiphilus TaxID=226217 RepID=A0ABN2P0S6_9ACTN
MSGSSAWVENSSPNVAMPRANSARFTRARETGGVVPREVPGDGGGTAHAVAGAVTAAEDMRPT